MSAAVHIVDSDLHAFADNNLPADRRASILAALESDTVEGRRVADWCSQNEAIRRILGKTAFEPVPVALSLAGMSRRQGDAGAGAATAEKTTPRLVEPAISAPKPRRHRWRTLGRLVALAMVVGAAGLFGVASSRIRPQAAITATRTDANVPGIGDGAAALFSARAIEAHRTFVTDNQFPVEIGSGQLPRLVQWFEKRLGQTVTIPDLRAAGFVLLGGRLIPGPRGPFALLVYQNAGGERMGLMFGKADGGGATMYYRASQAAGVAAVGVTSWAQDGDVLSLSGQADPARLSAVAKVAAAGFQAKERR